MQLSDIDPGQDADAALRAGVADVSLDPAKADAALAAAGVNPTARVEALSVETLIALGDALA